MQTMTVKTLKEKIDEGSALTVVDLQDPANFEHRHIPGAVNIPVSDRCDETCAALLKDKDMAIVLYGEFDELGKGDVVGEILEKAGYSNVARLTGGLMGWMEAGYTVEGGKAS